MGRRAAMLLVVVALLLAAAGLGAIAVVHRSARAAVDDLLQRRLEAVGATAARLLGVAHDGDAALADIAAANELDGAYVVDEQLMIVADAHRQRGRRANLLRLDADRAHAALAGQASVGRAFDVEGATFLGGYFPMKAAARQALVAIAGAARAARREREAFGEAERAGMASRMAAMVAHEVRNPLLTISGAAELLRERTTVARDRELVDDLLGEVHRINALTDEFLTLSRDSPLDRSRVDIGALARDVCGAVALRYGSLQLVASGDARA
ncbi:MAG: sensor histidine kinase, partial [Myxococcales bacterium]|nr:sensor histidine kinase [Myxococcales bacterium]